MARKNRRGLELSFKRYGKGRAEGRWYKVFEGKPIYFGTGSGVSDRASYDAALGKLRVHQGKAVEEKLVAEMGPAPTNGAALAPMTWTEIHKGYQAWQKSLGDGRGEGSGKATDLDILITAFINAQQKRNDKRHFVEKEQAAGKKLTEPKGVGAGIGDDRLRSIEQWTERLRQCVASMPWDGTDRALAAILKKGRDESEALLHANVNTANTFNERIKTGRQLAQWAYVNNHVEHLPRNLNELCSKYDYEGTARALPVKTIKTLWAVADDQEKAWIALALNCGMYAKDISDIKGSMIDGEYLDHRRMKIKGELHVRYKLWPVTRELLRRTRMDDGVGRLYLTEDGTPLVLPPRKEGGKEKSRVDNCRNHWQRLCKTAKVKGFSFSNLRDTSATWVDGQPAHKPFADLFLSHKDDRMAKYYVDGRMVDTTPLDELVDELRAYYGLTVDDEVVTADQVKQIKRRWAKDQRPAVIARKVGVCRKTVMKHKPRRPSTI